MNIKTLIVLLAAAAVAAYLIKNDRGKAQNAASQAPAMPKTDNSQVVHLIEETLHRHEGEDNPIVQAFEAALEHETKHDNGLVPA